jgi:hypothetical protein
MKLVPKIVIELLAEMAYVSGLGDTKVTVGCGAVTVKAVAKVADNPPADAGFVTWIEYTPGGNAVFGHQNRNVLALTYT